MNDPTVGEGERPSPTPITPADLSIVRLARRPAATATGNEHFHVWLADGSAWYCKPDPSGGGRANRELAGERVLAHLGWGRLTARVFVRRIQLPEWKGPLLCSLQELIEEPDDTTRVSDHDEIDTARAAAYDYLTKETDRHLTNFARTPDRELFLYDHSECFQDPIVPAHSEFVNHWDRWPLPEVVVEELRSALHYVDWSFLDDLVGLAHRERLVERLRLLCSGGRILA